MKENHTSKTEMLLLVLMSIFLQELVKIRISAVESRCRMSSWVERFYEEIIKRDFHQNRFSAILTRPLNSLALPGKIIHPAAAILGHWCCHFNGIEKLFRVPAFQE